MYTERALELLRSVSRHGTPLENHCSRLVEFALSIGQLRGVDLDADLFGGIGFLHDIGLCVQEPTAKDYLARGLAFSIGHMRDWGLPAEQETLFEQAMLYNHSFRPVPGLLPEAECLRLAVQVEHSLGRVRHGLDRPFVRDVFARHPRRGFNRVLLSFTRTAMRDGGPLGIYRLFAPVTRIDAEA